MRCILLKCRLEKFRKNTVCIHNILQSCYVWCFGSSVDVYNCLIDFYLLKIYIQVYRSYTYLIKKPFCPICTIVAHVSFSSLRPLQRFWTRINVSDHTPLVTGGGNCLINARAPTKRTCFSRRFCQTSQFDNDFLSSLIYYSRLYSQYDHR